jgi:hypothetical protein
MTSEERDADDLNEMWQRLRRAARVGKILFPPLPGVVQEGTDA